VRLSWKISPRRDKVLICPKETFFNVVKNIPCLFPATKVLGSKWAVGAEAGLTESVVDSIRYLRHDATPFKHLPCAREKRVKTFVVDKSDAFRSQ